MIFAITIFATLVGISFASPLACPSPNNTDNALKWFDCNGGSVQYTNFTVTNQDGSTDYPVKLKSPIFIAEYENNNGPTQNALFVDAKVYEWGNLFGCGWHNIPTFGLTNNINGCGVVAPCPYTGGPHTFKANFDISKYAPITALMSNSNPYMVTLTLKDGNKNPIGCLSVQFKIDKDH
jgi:hypothetical protein